MYIAMSRKVEISNWFQKAISVDLYLPDRCFGRPTDFQHQLSFIEERPHKLLLELCQQFLIVLTDCKTICLEADRLILKDFSQFVFDWQGFGDLTPHVQVYLTGELRFVAQPKI